MYVEGYLYFSSLEKWPSIGDVLFVPAVHSPHISIGQGLAVPRVGSELFGAHFCKLPAFIFLASGACLLVFEGSLEIWAGFLVGEACPCPLVGGARSWPSGGQGHIKDCV